MNNPAATGVLTPIHFDEASQAFLNSVMDGPVLVAEDQVQRAVQNLVALTLHDEFPALNANLASSESDEDFWSLEGYRAQFRPYNVVNGTLVIPVQGTLINRWGFQIGRTATGYEYIERAFNRGMDDPAVKSILFHVDSPGGQAAGNFELVEKIAARRGEKTMVAMVEDHSLSAAYSISTAANEIVTTRSGMTGSVGVLVMHLDVSKMLADLGIKVTFIKAGARKVEGNPFEPLSKSARESIQGRVDKLYATFVNTVATNREISESAVRDTEAAVFDAEESIEIGFSDRIGEFRDEMAALAAVTLKGSMTMSNENQAAEAVDTTKVAADAKADERNRFSTVMTAAEYTGREKLANHLLGSTEMDAAAIIATLAVSPIEQTETPEPAPAPTSERNHFAEHMNKTGGAGVTPEASNDSGEQAKSPEAIASGILDAYEASGGRTRRQHAHH